MFAMTHDTEPQLQGIASVAAAFITAFLIPGLDVCVSVTLVGLQHLCSVMLIFSNWDAGLQKKKEGPGRKEKKYASVLLKHGLILPP